MSAALSYDDVSLLRDMVSCDGEVQKKRGDNVLPIFPQGGDRRCRPVRWVERDRVDRLLRDERLETRDNMIVVARKTVRAIRRGELKAELNSQTELEPGESYTPDGVMRPVRRNRNVSVLRRLARRRDSYGNPVITTAELEAGEQFARDYALAGKGYVATQDYSGVHVDGGAVDGAENAIISRIDRRRRLSEAISCLGGLDRILVAVCCEDRTLQDVEYTEQWAKNSGQTVLKLALQRMVQFYGTVPGECQRKR